MANFSIKLDLLKLQGAFVTNIKGKNSTKKCVCIPVDSLGLFLGSKSLYLTLSANEMQNPKYDDTHLVKVQLSKKEYNQLSETARKEIPVLGGMHEASYSSSSVSSQGANIDLSDEEIPF